MILMGGISLIEFIIRIVFFTIFESPKCLMGKGWDKLFAGQSSVMAPPTSHIRIRSLLAPDAV